MDLNATLIGQMITFVVFVLFTMKYVWPPITKAMHEREKKIAEGLAAGERAERDLELAQKKSLEIIKEAKTTADGIVQHAHDRANHIVEEAKVSAKQEAERLISGAHVEIEQQVIQTKAELKKEVAVLALSMAEKIVQQEINPSVQKRWLDEVITEI